MSAWSEAIESLDTYKTLKQEIDVIELQGAFSHLFMHARRSIPYTRHRTARRSRKYTFLRPGPDVDHNKRPAVAHPFEFIWKQSNSESRDVLTTVRLIDPEKVVGDPENKDKTWYDPILPPNIRFSFGHYGDDSDLWATFDPGSAVDLGVGVEATQLVQPESSHAKVLGHIALHVQEGLREFAQYAEE